MLFCQKSVKPSRRCGVPKGPE